MITVRLKELALEQDISQREVWRRAQKFYPQLTWAAMNHFANGDTAGVSYLLLGAVCRALRCTPGDLLQLEASKRSGQTQPEPAAKERRPYSSN